MLLIKKKERFKIPELQKRTWTTASSRLVASVPPVRRHQMEQKTQRVYFNKLEYVSESCIPIIGLQMQTLQWTAGQGR